MPASPNVGNYRFPFKHIPDISGEAARQIRRNFESVFNLQTGSIFDAIIDPAQTVSSAANHIYKNLTDLIASESWVSSRMFNVGVKQRFNIAITEPAETLDVRGVGDLSLFGISNAQVDATHFAWVWSQLQCNLTQQVFYYNLAIDLDGGTAF